MQANSKFLESVLDTSTPLRNTIESRHILDTVVAIIILHWQRGILGFHIGI